MDLPIVLQELQYKAVRSSGPGGQHVNKTATKIEVTFSIDKSRGLSEEEKAQIHKRLATRVTQEGILILQCGETRSQLRNKKIVTERIMQLLIDSLKKPKKRRPTKPSRKAIQKRLDAKKKQAQKKTNRKPPKL